MASGNLKITPERCDTLVAFIESNEGQDALERLRSSHKALMILSDLDRMMGSEENLYVTGDGLVAGMTNVFIDNVQQPPRLKPVKDLKEFVSRSGYSCRIPDHCLDNIPRWICESIDSSAEEIGGAPPSIK